MDSITEDLQKISLDKGENVNKIVEIKRTLLGTYNWKEDHEIYIPGFPATLRPNYYKINVPRLDDSLTTTARESHPNQYLHDIYFEPIQEILSHAQKQLSSFDIVTDKNNIRKLDAALTNDTKIYTDYTILLRKFGNVLVVKREEPLGNVADTPSGSAIGKSFEQALTRPSPFFTCHAVIHSEVPMTDRVYNLLIRGEIDCCLPSVQTPAINSYSLEKTTSTGLHVYKLKTNQKPLLFSDLREIKMTGTLLDHHYFQSWIIGVPEIVHGVRRRQESPVPNSLYDPKLRKVIAYLLECKDKMKDDVTYCITRTGGENLSFGEHSDSSLPKWLRNEI